MINGYSFYDSKQAVSPEELANLYRFTRWARSRSLEDIGRMLAGTSWSTPSIRERRSGRRC